MIVKSESQNYLCRIVDYDIISDAAEDKGGTGLYIRPHELLEGALASCMNITIRMEADRKGIKLDSVETTVKLDCNDPAKTIFKYSFNIKPEQKLESEIVNDFERALQNCAVRRTLSKEIIFIEKR